VKRALTIARNTFREAVRDRVLHLVAAFGVLVLLSGKVIGWVSVGEDIKIVRDIGLTSVGFFGAMIALFVGTGLIQRELGGRTIYTILARPVARWEFIIGKYLGLLGTVLIATAGMAVVFLVYLGIMTALAPGAPVGATAAPSAFGWPVFQSLILSGFEMVMMTALAVFFSSVSTPILSAVFTFFAYVAGQFASSVSLLAEMAAPKGGSGSWLGHVLLDVIYRVMPNLDLMNIRDSATHGYAVSAGQMVWTIVYAIAYAGVVLAVTCAAFERRNMP